MITLTAYSDPDRHYHNWDHIRDCLRELSDVRHLVSDMFALYTAILFHDCVYKTDETSKSNERASAQAAITWLNQSPVSRIVHALIMVTRHSAEFPPLNDDEKIMCDIDLASLGASPEIFAKHSANIRLEYAAYGDNVYAPARIKILQSFLDRRNIYYTPYFRDKYEEQARQNLTKEIENLRLMGLVLEPENAGS
jgi:predicted metal-dependent HD superfamily phosphohydrolase